MHQISTTGYIDLGFIGNSLVLINKVTLRRVWLVARLVVFL